MFDSVQSDPPDEGLVPPPPTEWSTIRPDGFLPLELEQHYVAPGDFEQVERIGAWDRVIAWAQSMQPAEMASFVSRGQTDAPTMRQVAQESAVAEIGLMLRVATGTARLRVHDAQTLIERYPASCAALRAGQITLPKATGPHRRLQHRPGMAATPSGQAEPRMVGNPANPTAR